MVNVQQAGLFARSPGLAWSFLNASVGARATVSATSDGLTTGFHPMPGHDEKMHKEFEQSQKFLDDYRSTLKHGAVHFEVDADVEAQAAVKRCADLHEHRHRIELEKIKELGEERVCKLNKKISELEAEVQTQKQTNEILSREKSSLVSSYKREKQEESSFNPIQSSASFTVREKEFERKKLEFEQEKRKLTQELEICRSKFSDTEHQLESCRAELTAKNAQLESCRAELTAKNAQLESCRAESIAKSGQLESCREEVNAQSATIRNCRAEITAKIGYLAAADQKLRDARENQERMRESHEEQYEKLKLAHAKESLLLRMTAGLHKRRFERWSDWQSEMERSQRAATLEDSTAQIDKKSKELLSMKETVEKLEANKTELTHRCDLLKSANDKLSKELESETDAKISVQAHCSEVEERLFVFASNVHKQFGGLFGSIAKQEVHVPDLEPYNPLKRTKYQVAAHAQAAARASFGDSSSEPETEAAIRVDSEAEIRVDSAAEIRVDSGAEIRVSCEAQIGSKTCGGEHCVEGKCPERKLQN